MRLIPEPTFDGLRENGVTWQPEWGDELDHMATLLNALAAHTTTPDDRYVRIQSVTGAGCSLATSLLNRLLTSKNWFPVMLD